MSGRKAKEKRKNEAITPGLKPLGGRLVLVITGEMFPRGFRPRVMAHESFILGFQSAFTPGTFELWCDANRARIVLNLE